MFLTGQVAGVAAALAAKAGELPRDLNVRELQRALHEEYSVPLGDEDRLRVCAGGSDNSPTTNCRKVTGW